MKVIKQVVYMQNDSKLFEQTIAYKLCVTIYKQYITCFWFSFPLDGTVSASL